MDCKRAKRVWKDFEIKNVGQYHDFYIQINIPLLADVFESLQNKCIEIYKLDLAHSFYFSIRTGKTSSL